MIATKAGNDLQTRKLHHRTATVKGLKIFYREAGPSDAPVLLLLPGFPAASYQYAPLMRRLADRVHVISPDYPGFGYSDAPASSNAGGSFVYSFDHLAEIIGQFLDTIGQRRFFLYMFDFGAPVGFRIALKHPQSIRGIIAQNGNAYEEGLGPNMQPLRPFWKDRAAHTAQVKGALSFEATRGAHLEGVRDAELIDPDTWTLDQHWLDQPGRAPIMLDLFYDYQTNVAAYPDWQAWLRKNHPPVLLPWGKNDGYFPGAGAQAYLKDVPDAELHLLDAGHFALDDHLDEIATLVAGFIARHSH
ncbi:MAG: alpha/beta hydrolase [Rhodanobacteraceae bacterium]|nr:MAG: alpha/beta hydrolase [Rhodanobacteraceae bacterium]